jgi:hypothetical protein
MKAYEFYLSRDYVKLLMRILESLNKKDPTASSN